MIEAKIALSLLLNLTQRFTSEDSLEALLQAVTDTTLQLLPGDHASVRVFNEPRDELLCGARSGQGAGDVPMVFHPGEGVIGWVAEHGWVANIEDAETDARFVAGPAQAFSVKSLLAVPILSAAQVVAVLSTSSSEPRTFAPEDEALALLLANATSPLIDRARLQRLALVDELTGAYNDRYLLPRLRNNLEQAAQSGAPLSLLMLDLDHLSPLNRAHSFEAGNRVIRQVAERVRAHVQPNHCLVRRGGGTFILLLPETNREAALDLARRLRAAVAESPISLDSGPAVVQKISVGVATWDQTERSLAFLERADAALRTAKENGRDRVEPAPERV